MCVTENALVLHDSLYTRSLSTLVFSFIALLTFLTRCLFWIH